MNPLVQQIVTLLQPYLPALLAEGAKAIGSEGGKRIVGTLWEKLKGKPKVVEAAKEMVEAHGDETVQGIFALRIEQAMKDDPALLAELTKLLSQTGNVLQAGARGVVIGGNANGATIITGDRNIVGSGNTVNNVRADKIIGSAIGDGSKVINRMVGGDDD